MKVAAKARIDKNGPSMLGRHHSPETIAKIRAARWPDLIAKKEDVA
jgi:hypothetical protein